MAAITSSPLHVREGDHLNIRDYHDLPYKTIRHLGIGGYAAVSLVEDTNGDQFAHKQFKRYDGPDIKKFQRQVQNEVSIMRRLSSHPHIVRVFASYTCDSGRDLGLILTPVADSRDLAIYLQAISDSGNHPTTEQRTILERAFGCLASGLAFIHEQTIRHKDIKPSNILVHQGCVIYTDFGIAFDANDLGCTTTDGTVEAVTRRYCAPEVADLMKRNRKSDVFSLGCVFTEILATLEPQI
ncbi:kinase-like protein, partial [Zopfia rhizophila CBS 207.26]